MRRRPIVSGWDKSALGDCAHGRSLARWLVAVLTAILMTAAPPAQAKDVTPLQGPTDADALLKDASGQWAAPRCVGDGEQGPRVQPVFVYRAGKANRFEKFRSVLMRSTYLTSGIVERSSGGLRAVRWVHDDSCAPVIWQVAVPATSTYNLVQLRRYLKATDPRFRNPDRVFALWVDARTGQSWSGLGDDRWSATWSSSFGFIWADAHELIHALGAVSARAPHATGRAHCWDGHDVMCYDDGGTPWGTRIICRDPVQKYRLDCGQDDYFAVAPARGSWLARHPRRNVANSRFLQRTVPVPLPVAPAAPVNVSRTAESVDWDAVVGLRYDVGYMGFIGELRWVAQDLSAGHADLVDVPASAKIFVRAVNDAGVSRRTVAVYR